MFCEKTRSQVVTAPQRFLKASLKKKKKCLPLFGFTTGLFLALMFIQVPPEKLQYPPTEVHTCSLTHCFRGVNLAPEVLVLLNVFAV